MAPSARDAYLETQVLTATPQKLRLMLIEGAIRFVLQTEHLWDVERFDDAFESLIRAREIVGELMASLDPQKSPLAKQILPLYAFITRTLTEAQRERSRAKLHDALRILNEERETWSQVCAKCVDAEAPGAAEEITASSTISAAPAPIPVAPRGFDSSRFAAEPNRSAAAPTTFTAPQGVSFEA
jgi:flagellar protein FliS